MNPKDVKCGIVGIGLYFPENVRTYKEIAKLSGIPEDVIRDKFGITKIYIPGEKDQTSWMAVQAAEDCLSKTGIDPKEIDLMIYFGENYADYQNWSVGIKVQESIGAINAWNYDLDCKCGTAIVAMDQAKKYMALDDGINTVMLVGGYRNVDHVDYKDQSVSFLFNVSCGGAAAILKKGYKRNLILESAAIVDPSFWDAIVVPGGGTKTPFTAENINDDYLKYFRLLPDPNSFRERLGAVTFKNLYQVAENACTKSGLTVNDIDFVVPLHMKKSGSLQVVKDLGLSEDKMIYLSDYGHCGQLDPLIGLKLAGEKNLIKDGDIVALLAMGFGYIWNGGIVKWGE